MSRIGKRAIEIPQNVNVEINGTNIVVTGPKGRLELVSRPEIEVVKKDNLIESTIKVATKASNAYWGLTNALIKSMIGGVVNGYEKKLELVGVGYRVTQLNPTTISLSVGYSHPVEVVSPQGITLQVEDNNKITVSGIDKQLVGLVASNIRKIRKPEPYKGKGIKYANEIIRRKVGKSGKTAK